MMNYARLCENLRRHEGESREAYRDSEGHWTIGRGHLMETDPSMDLIVAGLNRGDYPNGYRISDSKIADLFGNDVREAVNAARRIFPAFDMFSDYQQESLVEMVFQMGERGVRNFKNMCRTINLESPVNWPMALLHGADSEWFRKYPRRAFEVLEGFIA